MLNLDLKGYKIVLYGNSSGFNIPTFLLDIIFYILALPLLQLDRYCSYALLLDIYVCFKLCNYSFVISESQYILRTAVMGNAV